MLRYDNLKRGMAWTSPPPFIQLQTVSLGVSFADRPRDVLDAVCVIFLIRIAGSSESHAAFFNPGIHQRGLICRKRRRGARAKARGA